MEDKGIMATNASIVANTFGENALDRKDVMDIFNNPNGYPLPLELYNRDKGLLEEAKRQVQISNEEMLARKSATLSSQEFAKISLALDEDEKKKIIEQEKILTNQYKNAKANPFDRFWAATKRNYYGMDLNAKYWEIAERQHNGEDVDFNTVEIKELEDKINDLGVIKAGKFTEATGAFAGSSGQFVLPAILGGTVAAKLPQFRLANFVVQSVNVYDKSKKAEAGSLYKELLDDGYDKETSYAFASMYGDFAGVVESAGFGIGSGFLMNKAIKSVAKKMITKDGVKEAIKALDKKTLTQIFKETIKDSALSAIPETAEEVLQNEAAKKTKEMVKQGEKPSLGKLIGGSYEKVFNNTKNVFSKMIKGEELSDDEQEFADTAFYTYFASLALGSPVAGISAVAEIKGQDKAVQQKASKMINDATSNAAKTQKAKELMSDNKLREESTELDNKLTDLIIKSNNTDGNIYLSQEGVETLLEKSQEDKELAEFIAPYKLGERAKNSVDGMIAVPMNEAKDLIFSEEADKVFSYISSDISWSKDTLTPNQTSEVVSKAVSDDLFGVKQETFDELTQKLYDKNIEQKFDEKKAKEFAKAEATVALNVANSLSANDKEHDTQYYLNQILASTSVDKPAVNNDVVNGVFDKNFAQVAEENARLDEQYPTYEGETINIGGTEKTVYNSAGERIAKSAEALQNFYNWFGDSKVVDEQGRPLVMYHGTRQRGISKFKSKYGDKLIFFAYKRDFSERWAKNAYHSEEQQEKARKISEEKREKQKEISERYKKDFGENWVDDKELFESAMEESKAWQLEREEELGISPIVMTVYLKAENTFDPEKDWEKVLPELLESNGFTKEDAEESTPEEIKKAEEEYEKKVAELDKKEDDEKVEPNSKEWKKNSKEYDRLYQELQAIRDKGKSFKQHLERIKKGAWVYFEHESVMKKIRELGYDSIRLKEYSDGEYSTLAVFEGNNQIKSTDNRGTYSTSDENIFKQKGFAGSPKDYDRPSLEAIGSGEGQQAHGYGLYYALNRFIAESYRRTFVVDKLIEKITSEMEKISQQSADKWNRSKIYEELDLLISSPSEEHLKEYISRIQNKYDFLSTNSKLTGRTDQEIEAKEYRKILDILKSMKPKDYTGQVVEVDLPENVFLLDEQKTLDEQPENVINLLSRVGLISKTNTSFDEFLDYIKKTYSNTKYGEDVSELIDSYAFRDLLSLSKEKNILSKKDEQRLKFYTQTGRDFYKELSIELGSDEAASRKLSKIGIKGITYNGREDGRCFVIFDDKDVEVLDKFYERIGGKANLTPAMEASREEAKKMAKENVAPLEILKKTGWEFDDGHWKYEIDDSKSKVKDFKVGAKGLELPDVLDHPELYELYPFLKEMPVTWGRSETRRGAYHYAIRYLTGEITDQHISLSRALTKTKKAKEELRKTLIHEIQHAIQHHEGWKGGSSGGRLTANQNRQFFSLLMFADAISEAFSKYDIETPSQVLTHAIYSMEKLEEPLKELIKADPEYTKTVELFKKEADKHREEFKKTSLAKYWRDLGEKEARNSTIRRNMTPEQRRNIPYSATTDIEPIEITYGGETVQIIDPTETENTSSVAGYFEPSSVQIRLTEARNPTTFSHELFHYFMFNMVNIYNNGTMKDEWKKPFVKTMKWAGAEEVDGKYSFDPTTDRETQEKLAEAFTSYLLEGKAPVKEVKTLFDIIKDMFKVVYQSLRMKNVRLNKDVTMFFDKIFAAEGEIELQLRAEKVGVLKRPDGISDEDWNKYIELKEKSRGEAVNKTIDAMAKREEVMTTQAYKEQYDNAFNEKMNELNVMPEYIALETAEVQKFSKESVDANVKEGSLNKKFIATDKELEDIDNNVVANDIASFAESYGFDSVTELVEFLNNTDSKKDIATNYAQEKADEWLKENYPTLDEIEAKNAIRTTALIKTLIMEYMMLNKIPLDRFNLYFNEMRKTANAIIGSSKLNEIANVEGWYKRLANLINRISALQVGKNDRKIAGLKMKCAMLNYTILVAKEVKRDYGLFNRHFKKYKNRPTSNALKRIEGKAWNIIADVLRSYGMISGKIINPDIAGRIESYVNGTLLERYSSISEILKDIPYLVNSTNTPRKNLTVENFLILDKDLRLLENASIYNRTIVREGQQMELDEAVKNIIADADDKNVKPWTKENHNVLKRIFIEYLGIPETMMSQLFPKREFIKYILGFQEGCAKAERWRTETSKKLAEIIEPVMKLGNKEIKIGDNVWKMSELLVIMLNAGNEHNARCMAKTIQIKKGLEEFTYEDFMDLIMSIQPAIEAEGYTGFDIRLIAQQVWNLFESYVPAMRREQEKIDAREITLVEKTKIKFPDGKEIDGGYYPARKVDYTPTIQSVNDTNGFIQTTFSFTLDRDNSIHEIPIDLSMLTSWVSQMGKLLFVANKANDLEKIVRNHEFRLRLGDKLTEYILDWLGASIAPERMSPTLAYLGAMSSSYFLGSKLASLGVQFAGIVNAIPVVGFLPLSKSLAKLSTVAEIIPMYRQAFTHSVYIRDRYSTPQNHLLGIEDIDKFLASNLSKAQKTTTAVMMSAVTYGDMLASLVVWDAAYNRALNEGHTHKQARLLADSAVRTTQSDTSASSKPKVLRGVMRLLSPFASYFIAAHNLVSSRLVYGGNAGKIQAIAVLMVLCTLSPIVETMLRSPFDWYGGDDDDKKKWRKKGIHTYEDFFKEKAKENTLSTAFNVVLPVYGISGNVSYYFETGKMNDSTIMPINTLTKLVSAPFAAIRTQIAPTEKQREKSEKDLAEIAGIIAGINVENFEKSLRFLTTILGGK